MDGRRRSCRPWSELFYHRLLAAVEHHDGGILEGRPFNREVEGQAEGVPQAALIELAAADGDVGQLPVVVADGLAVVLCFVGLACLLEQVLQGYGILEYDHWGRFSMIIFLLSLLVLLVKSIIFVTSLTFTIKQGHSCQEQAGK